ncbi:MAG: helix-turn-helix domain-containing protein [Treponema sp.]|jgi:cytoskeletal protein RodZ|nr:helix-turn-helix domain-containing protein [Treponema sp.]
MESLGDKLRKTREGKGYSYEYVGRETNIAQRYLEALEGEDFSKFPGEPYLLGFLRNYGDYLGLDVDELLSLYRAIKIQEQPIPVEQLLRSPRTFPKPILALVIILPLLFAAALGAYVLFIRIPVEPVRTDIAQRPMEYLLEGPFLERRFYRGDTILVPLGEERFKTELRTMDDPLTLTVPGGEAALNLFGDTDVDVNGDGIADVRVTLSDYDKNSPGAGAMIRFTVNPSSVSDPALPEISAAQSGVGTVIFSSTNTYPFTMEVQFQNYCLFRWELDRRERTERYFSRGERLNVPVQNTIRLWISNATAAAIVLNGAGRNVTLDLGSAGEVVVIDLRWLRDNDGRYRLTQYRLE